MTKRLPAAHTLLPSQSWPRSPGTSARAGAASVLCALWPQSPGAPCLGSRWAARDQSLPLRLSPPSSPPRPPPAPPGGRGLQGAAPKVLWGLTQNLAPEPRCRVWGFTTVLCPGGLPLVGKMLLDPEPIPLTADVPCLGQRVGWTSAWAAPSLRVSSHAHSRHALSAPGALPVPPSSPAPRRGVCRAGQRPASMTRRHGSLWRCPAPARVALMVRLSPTSVSPWGASSPSRWNSLQPLPF